MLILLLPMVPHNPESYLLASMVQSQHGQPSWCQPKDGKTLIIVSLNQSMSLSQVCIWQYYPLDIPYNQYQVCPPGLQITLGIFLWLFVLLEDACHHLDLTAELNGSERRRSFECFSTTRESRRMKSTQYEANLLYLNRVLHLGCESKHCLLTSGLSTAGNRDSD